MQCWHQVVTVETAKAEDRYGDVRVDTKLAREKYREWLAMARPAKGNLRRPLWFKRPVKPAKEMYYFDGKVPE